MQNITLFWVFNQTKEMHCPYFVLRRDHHFLALRLLIVFDAHKFLSQRLMQNATPQTILYEIKIQTQIVRKQVIGAFVEQMTTWSQNEPMETIRLLIPTFDVNFSQMCAQMASENDSVVMRECWSGCDRSALLLHCAILRSEALLSRCRMQFLPHQLPKVPLQMPPTTNISSISPQIHPLELNVGKILKMRQIHFVASIEHEDSMNVRESKCCEYRNVSTSRSNVKQTIPVLHKGRSLLGLILFQCKYSLQSRHNASSFGYFLVQVILVEEGIQWEHILENFSIVKKRRQIMIHFQRIFTS
mmetsp:Transcript_6159/g.23249  ORF Transcript_6159/g.23249 Transcript_6159/m.23249 type:complete len:301 (-) Transcript_6159:168-1070(-)